MKKTEFFIGRNFQDNVGCTSGKVIERVSQWSKEYMETEVSSILAREGIDGYSALWINGMWKGEAEDTYCVVLFHDFTDEFMKAIARSFRNTFEQESVLIATQELQVSFI